MAETLHFSLVSPERELFSGAVDQVDAPGVEGEFGVLPGHVPFVSALRAGVLTVRSRDRRNVYAVGPGYLQVAAAGKTQVLVQQAVAAEDVELEEVRQEKVAVEEQLKQLTGAAGEQSALATRLAWAQAQIEAAAKAGK